MQSQPSTSSADVVLYEHLPAMLVEKIASELNIDDRLSFMVRSSNFTNP